MKKLLSSVCFCTLAFLGLHSQDVSVDEIINNYLEVVGGENYSNVENYQAKGLFRQGGQEFPYVSTLAKGNKMHTVADVQGKKVPVQVFNGKEGWGINFMTMTPEKWPEEQNIELRTNQDFPERFFDYKTRGYSASLEGEESIEGVECYKVKLTKNPVVIGEEKNEVFEFYYFDKDSGVPILSEAVGILGQMKGLVTQTYYSEYDEFDGIIIPTSIVMKMNGQTMYEITIDETQYNVEIDESIYEFPETTAAGE